jgi:hypothetical protein
MRSGEISLSTLGLDMNLYQYAVSLWQKFTWVTCGLDVIFDAMSLPKNKQLEPAFYEDLSHYKGR